MRMYAVAASVLLALGCGKSKVGRNGQPSGDVPGGPVAAGSARTRAPVALRVLSATATGWFSFEGYYWVRLPVEQMPDTTKEPYGFSFRGKPLAINCAKPSALEAMAKVTGPVAIWANAKAFADPQIRAAIGKLGREHPFSLTLEDVGNEDLAGLAGLDTLAMLSIMTTKVDSAGVATLPVLPGLVGLRLDAHPSYDLTAPAIDAIARLPALRHLDVKALQIRDEEMRQLARIATLETLDLSSSSLTVDGYKSLAKLPKLDVLILNKAEVPAGALAELAALDIRGLDFEQTWIKSDVIGPLASMKNLEYLSLNSTSVTTLPGLSNWPKLRALDLSATSITDASLAGLETLRELEVLDLSFTKLTAGVVPKLAGASKLRELELTSVKLGDDELAGLATCCKSLAVLELGHVTSVGPKTLAAIGALTNLEELDLEEVAIGDADIHQLASLTKLRRLSLRYTQITDKSLEVLRQLPKLEWLDVSYAKAKDKDGGFSERVKYHNYD